MLRPAVVDLDSSERLFIYSISLFRLLTYWSFYKFLKAMKIWKWVYYIDQQCNLTPTSGINKAVQNRTPFSFHFLQYLSCCEFSISSSKKGSKPSPHVTFTNHIFSCFFLLQGNYQCLTFAIPTWFYLRWNKQTVLLITLWYASMNNVFLIQPGSSCVIFYTAF